MWGRESVRADEVFEEALFVLPGFPVEGRFALEGAEFLFFQPSRRIALVLSGRIIAAFAFSASQSDDFLCHWINPSIARSPRQKQRQAGNLTAAQMIIIR